MKFAPVTAGLVLTMLAACGTTNSDGSLSGPLGQEPLMTSNVQQVTAIALDACIGALTKGQSLSQLQARGFTASRGGYRRKIDNPLIFAGNSSVRATLKGDQCHVATEPVYPIEVQTMRTLTSDALARNRANLNASMRFTTGAGIAEAILR